MDNLQIPRMFVNKLYRGFRELPNKQLEPCSVIVTYRCADSEREFIDFRVHTTIDDSVDWHIEQSQKNNNLLRVIRSSATYGTISTSEGQLYLEPLTEQEEDALVDLHFNKILNKN